MRARDSNETRFADGPSGTGTHYFHRRADGRPVATCDRCGMAYPDWKVKYDWRSLRVCFGADTANCWEEMHPELNFTAPTDNSLAMPDPRLPRDANGMVYVDQTTPEILPVDYAFSLAMIKARGLPS